MALKGFRKPPQNEGPMQALTIAVGDFTRQLEQNPLLDGRIIKDITISTAATNVSHGLNRQWIGWFVVSKASSASIYETTQVNTSQYLTLIASSSATVDIYVF
jgi:hypothetical protein